MGLSPEQEASFAVAGALRQLEHIFTYAAPNTQQLIEHGLRLEKHWTDERPLSPLGNELAIACSVRVTSNDSRKLSKLDHPATPFSQQYAEVYRRNAEHENLVQYRIEPDATHPIQLYDGTTYLPIGPTLTPAQWQDFTELIDVLER